MSGNKKTDRAKVLKKLRQFRERWAGHEGADTPFGHMFLGPKDNGVQKRAKNGEKKKHGERKS
jgi:hypothetical protein